MKNRLKFEIGSISLFISEIVLFWIIWFINDYAWLNCLDKVTYILNILLLLGMILITATGIWVFIQILKDPLKKNVVSEGKKIVSLVILIIIIFLQFNLYSTFSKSIQNNTGGCINIKDKKIIGDLYYFYVEKPDKTFLEIECTKEIYGELVVDKDVLYLMQYRWLIYSNRGKLKNIDTKDFLDNRRR